MATFSWEAALAAGNHQATAWKRRVQVEAAVGFTPAARMPEAWYWLIQGLAASAPSRPESSPRADSHRQQWSETVTGAKSACRATSGGVPYLILSPVNATVSSQAASRPTATENQAVLSKLKIVEECSIGRELADLAVVAESGNPSI